MASDLTVKIDRTRKIASFTGNTFPVKEDIKALGKAQWYREKSAWEISSFTLSVEELREIFPNILVEEYNVGVRGGLNGLSPGNTPFSQDVALGPDRIEQDLIVVEVQKTALPPLRSDIPAGLSVGEVNRCLREVLLSAFPQRFFVYGVLANVRRQSSGRFYLDLADMERSDEYLDCVLWEEKGEAVCKSFYEAGFQFEKDLQVMFGVTVGFSPKGGRISLTIVEVVASYTIGKLAALRDQTNKKLEQEGIFLSNKQTVLPFLPKRLGILTSSGGTVIHDFRAALDQSRFGFELFWLPVSVQGAEAKYQIVSGFKKLSEVALDAILLFRGGGSPSELAVFNNYEIAKTICLCPVPVLSAIGHQVDQSSAQDVSCYAFGVPKDIGKFFAEIICDFRSRFHTALSGVAAQSSWKLEQEDQRFNRVCQDLPTRVFQTLVRKEELLRRDQVSISALALRGFEQSETALNNLMRLLLTLKTAVVERLRSRFERLLSSLVTSLRERNQKCMQELVSWWQRFQAGSQKILVREERRIYPVAQIPREANRMVEQLDQRLDYDLELINRDRPERQLERGFALIRTSKDGPLATRAAQIASQETIEIEFYDEKREAVMK